MKFKQCSVIAGTPKIMQMTYRASKFNTPSADETLVRTRDEGFALIVQIDKKLATGLSKQVRATLLMGRATLYEALGEPLMLEAAYEAYSFSKTANSAALVAVALHHFGRIKEANKYYKLAYSYPHEAGFEIDIGQEGALLSEYDKEGWLKAWKIVKKLKKRMVYAVGLPDWDGNPTKEVQIISEGGFGDLIINSRYLKMVKNKVEKVTVFLPPFFFEHGFVDLARLNDWWPETKVLTECKPKIPSAGFFDLPALFETTPETIPDTPIWRSIGNSVVVTSDRPRVGICWGAKAFETPLMPPGVYRTLTEEQATRIVQQTSHKIHWVNLQQNATSNLGIQDNPELKSWNDTATIISNLDAVVSVDTAVAHLSASLNKPTHVLLSGATDWKYGIGGDSCLWYPQMKLWRNNDFGFENTVSNIINAINEGSLF